MANTKRKCAHCKEYFLVGGDGIKTPAGYFCSFDHASLYAKAKDLKTKQAEFRKETAAMKRKLNDSDLKVRKNAARKACHDYIKERDKYQGCICCGKTLGDVFHAGHWFTSSQHPLIRYHEDNIHGQRVDCNYFKGGDSGQYRENLIAKIGLDRVEWLEANKSKPIKRTADDYKEIERYYKRKLRELKESRGEQ